MRLSRGRLLLIAGLVVAAAYVLAVFLVTKGDGNVAKHTDRGLSSYTTLRGPWILASDHDNTGIAKGWPAGHFMGSKVMVPFVPNANPKRLHGRMLDVAFNGTIAWYRTRFTTHKKGAYALDFESVNHKAHVWVDGKAQGVHVGEYLPFQIRFYAKPGRHTLVVRADYRDPEAMKRAGWHRTWFNYGGINRPVRLRRLGSAEIKTPVVTTRLLGGGRADVQVSALLRNRGPAKRLKLHGRLGNGGQSFILTFGAVRLKRGEERWVSTHVAIPRPALWSPERPQLSKLVLGVPKLARWNGRTGLRQVAFSGRQLTINGKRVVLRGAAVPEDAYGHGDALTGPDMDRLVAELKAIGANATRSQHPLAPALLDRLDAAGILVWQGIGPVDAPGAWLENTPSKLRTARARVRTSALQLQLHPSIVVWSLGNEIAHDGHSGGQPEFIDSQARALHRLDPGRLVGVDVWGKYPPASDAGLLLYRHLDVVGLTNYAGWYSDTGLRGAPLAAAVRRAVDQFKRAFPDKLVMVTEFGAEADPRNAYDRPGGLGFQADLLRTHIGVYRSDPDLSGMLLWSLRDFEVTPTFQGGSAHVLLPGLKIAPGRNEKGLFTYRGKPKPSVAVVRRAYTR